MKKKRLDWKKPVAVTAAALSAAALVTVSAGAALNWDIASLFVNANAAKRELPMAWFQKELREYYQNENFTDHTVSSESEYDILSAISREAEMEFDLDGRTVHTIGYAYDGNWLDLLYEVTYDDGTTISEDEIPYDVTVVTASDEEEYEDSGWKMSYSQVVGNTVRYRLKQRVRLPGDFCTVRVYFVDENDRLNAHIRGMAYESENFMDIELERNNPYSYYSDPNIKTDGGYTVTSLSITPFGIRIGGSSVEKVSTFKSPVIAVFSDGSVTDLYMVNSLAGEHEFFSYYSSIGILLDAREITELRIGESTIPING